MFYQNILTELSPYMARVSNLDVFGEHRHADIEIHYPLCGKIEVSVNKKNIKVNEGELLLISPMAAHSIPSCENESRKILTLIVGVSFLKKYFSYFSETKRAAHVIELNDGSELSQKLTAVLEETAALCQAKSDRNELLIRGNVCKICSYLIDSISAVQENESNKNRQTVRVGAIEKALEMIYYDHAKPLTVEIAASVTGYGKSNFCKIFKSITGDTFHNVLNHQRVESACALLSGTDLPIAEIAVKTGFTEAKTFCRVFKSITALSPGQYRKSTNPSTRICSANK